VLLLAGGDCLQKLLDRHGVARLNKLGAKRLKECGAEEAVALRKRLALAVRACTAGPLNFNYDAMIAVARIFTEPSKAFKESLRLHCESYVPSRFAASRFNLRERLADVMKAREPLLEVRLRALAQISQLAKLVTTPTPTPQQTKHADTTPQHEHNKPTRRPSTSTTTSTTPAAKRQYSHGTGSSPAPTAPTDQARRTRRPSTSTTTSTTPAAKTSATATAPGSTPAPTTPPRVTWNFSSRHATST
jgi:hypothetical protein